MSIAIVDQHSIVFHESSCILFAATLKNDIFHEQYQPEQGDTWKAHFIPEMTSG